MAKSSAAFRPKDRILHAVFGTGTIEEANSRYITIVFDEVGTKKFVTEMVKLQSSDTPAPAKPARRKKAKTTKASKAKASKASKASKTTKTTKASKASK